KIAEQVERFFHSNFLLKERNLARDFVRNKLEARFTLRHRPQREPSRIEAFCFLTRVQRLAGAC
ncbi:MAG: hypothetical protein ABH861_01820, partial [Patescibacteria group bacterium]